MSYIFQLCSNILNNMFIFTNIYCNANSSLLIQNILDSEYISYMETKYNNYIISNLNIVLYLKSNVIKIAKTFTGSKVISKLLEKIKLNRIESFLESILRNFMFLSMNE